MKESGFNEVMLPVVSSAKIKTNTHFRTDTAGEKFKILYRIQKRRSVKFHSKHH